MTPHDALTRRRLLKLIKEITEAMGEKYTDDALDPLVHDCFSEQASEINNSGKPAQLECLLRNGWTPADILGRLRVNKEEEDDDS